MNPRRRVLVSPLWAFIVTVPLGLITLVVVVTLFGPHR